MESQPRASRRSAIAAAMLVLGAFGVVLAGVRSPLFDLDRYAVTKELVLFATSCACAAVLMPRWQKLELGIVDVLLLAFVAWSGVSALLAANHWLSLRAFGVSFAGLVVWFATRSVAQAGHRRFVGGGLLAAAVLAAGLGAAQAYGVEIDWLATERAPGATFGNRNFLAHLLAIATPLLLVSAARSPRWYIRAPVLAAIALVACTIVLTRSRAAWLGVGAAMSVIAIAGFMARRLGTRTAGGVDTAFDEPVATAPHHAPRRARLVLVALVLGAGVAAAMVVPNRLEWVSSSPYSDTLAGLTNYREGSGHGRLIQYDNTLDLVSDHPWFGVGPGNWFVHYPRVTTPGDPSFAGADPIPTNPWPSSDWIAMLSERGVPGTALLVLAGLACAVVALRRVWSSDASSAAVGLAALGTLAATVVVGMFDAVLLLAAPTLFVWSLLGVLVPYTKPVRSYTIGRRMRRVALLAVVAFTTLLTIDAAGGVLAIKIAGDGSDRARVERALRLDPGNHRLHLLLAGRGRCQSRLPHARAAARLLPHHPAPSAALRACGAAPN